MAIGIYFPTENEHRNRGQPKVGAPCRKPQNPFGDTKEAIRAKNAEFRLVLCGFFVDKNIYLMAKNGVFADSPFPSGKFRRTHEFKGYYLNGLAAFLRQAFASRGRRLASALP